MPTDQIAQIFQTLNATGFSIRENAEITLEINPATVDQTSLDQLKHLGFNRFSVGVQTFSDLFLQALGREHSADDSKRTLQLLKRNNVVFSFDLMFGLPQQTLADLQSDLEQLCEFSPPHVSLYNLTLNPQHALNVGRADDDTQFEMFLLIEKRLKAIGLARYEVSNFSIPGFESRHNQKYWTGKPYWGIGVSAHSYLRKSDLPSAQYGARFWNAKSGHQYASDIQNNTDSKQGILQYFDSKNVEVLQKHEAMTDFFHTRLRQMVGFSILDFTAEFGPDDISLVESKLSGLVSKSLVENHQGRYRLKTDAIAMANQVFLELTFSETDFK